MNKVLLKDGRESKIDIWNFSQLEEYLSREDLPINKKDSRIVNDIWSVVEGFFYFRESLAREMKNFDHQNEYKNENLTPFEIQKQMNLPRVDYHKTIVVSLNDSPIGILFCQWIKCHGSFWQYHIRFIDVHRNYKNLGVGTNLVKTLDQSKFIKNKILAIGEFSEEGEEYMKHTLKRELKAKDYAIVYDNYFGQVPTKPGVYGKLR